MAGRVTACPNCGGRVEFRAATSLLAVCPYCASAVARVGDDVDELTILGKVAPLLDLGSPLALGISGRARGRSFTLVGGLQLDYGAGPWSEWYAAFEDGQWGWIAEAQGKVYLTFKEPVEGLPRYDEARVGSSFRVGKTTLQVVERREARFIAATGELPIRAAPGARFRYADVQGPDGVFGTIDYGASDEAEALFLGEELSHRALFDDRVLAGGARREALAQGMNCPNCGAGLALKAPDLAERVTCEACGSLLDCAKGSTLSLLRSAKARGPDPRIPLSSKGVLRGGEFTVFGHLVRSTEIDGVRYRWEEYLLHQEHVGFRWLVVSDDHYSFVEPVHAGNLPNASETRAQITYEGRSFRLFQTYLARVDSLRGEFYWKVEVDERVTVRDFVSPPFALSMESTGDEVVWSKGTYLDKSEIEKAFRLAKPLPRPRGIHSHQPNPHLAVRRTTTRIAAGLSVIVLAFAAVFMARSRERIVVDAEVRLAGLERAQASQGGAMAAKRLSTDPFELDVRGNLALRVEADVDNAWLYVGGTLEDVETGRAHPFGVEVSRYWGVEGQEAWEEGSRERTVVLGEIPRGQYVLRFAPEWSATSGPTRFRLTATSDVFILAHPIVLLAFLWLFPLLAVSRQFSFEKRRWAESDFGGD